MNRLMAVIQWSHLLVSVLYYAVKRWHKLSKWSNHMVCTEFALLTTQTTPIRLLPAGTGIYSTIYSGDKTGNSPACYVLCMLHFLLQVEHFHILSFQGMRMICWVR